MGVSQLSLRDQMTQAVCRCGSITVVICSQYNHALFQQDQPELSFPENSSCPFTAWQADPVASSDSGC